jgi:large subunit ribosomal protein L5
MKDITKKVQEELGIKNVMETPKITKIVVNMGVKNALSDKKNIESAATVLTQITGQKPKVTKAKKSIASFKLREGDQIGLMVTLRGKRMNNFYNKLITIVLPRIRDFHGVKRTSFDGKGNYALGFSEQTVFPEIDPGKADKVQGLEICIVTTAKDNTQGLKLLEVMGMPFVK